MEETSRETRAFDAPTSGERARARASEAGGVVSLQEGPPDWAGTEPPSGWREVDPVTRAIGLPPRAETCLPTLPRSKEGGDLTRDGTSGGPGDPPRSLGRYENLGEMARGGMGRVHRVRDLRLNRELAFKLMLGHDHAPDLERRFLDEAQITGQLQHPGIPPVHELGRLDDGSLYYTMKLIKGSCSGRGYTVCKSVRRILLEGNTRPLFVREIEVDLSDVPAGGDVRVVPHATIWDSYQDGAHGKARAGILSPDDVSEKELAIRFPPGRKPTTPPSLYVFHDPSTRVVVPATTQNLTNPQGRDWWAWRPRDIRKDVNYQIEWAWRPERAG